MVPDGASDHDEPDADSNQEEAADALGLGGFLHADLDEGVSLDDLGRAYAELMGGGDDPYEPRQPETELAEIQELVDRETDGLGMGLALVKRAAESAGASIGIEGNGGAERGTIVRIVWPLEILT